MNSRRVRHELRDSQSESGRFLMRILLGECIFREALAFESISSKMSDLCFGTGSSSSMHGSWKKGERDRFMRTFEPL